MAPATATAQLAASKIKRPVPPGIQTNGIHSSTSSPSPSMSAGRLPNSGKPPNSATINGPANNGSVRSASRVRKEPPSQLLGRGQRINSVGLRSASIVGDSAASQAIEPIPYLKTEAYILKKYRACPPSLIVHLHPTHFRFDQQEGSFSYKSPMRIVIEHFRERTIPHELVEHFTDVPFYEGCMIVQIHDHKSTAPLQDVTRESSGGGKAMPSSIHNYNPCLTPSPYVPYPTQGNVPAKGKVPAGGDAEDKSKTAAQKDKENMPAPAFPVDGQRSKQAAQPKKPKVSTIVLQPTSLSNHIDLAMKAAEAITNGDGRRDSRQDGPLSATVPPTPTIPQTPQASMPPPAKRQKKGRLEIDSGNIYAAESQIARLITAPLVLDPVSSASESAALLESLAHPMHSYKPPSPKQRKRTVAEMAADEALEAEQERYMLILDERLSSKAAGAQGGGVPADGDGPAGGATFEPRFERFKAIENIKAQHEENKKHEKLRQQEADRKANQERERERLRLESEKKDQERQRVQQLQHTARQQEIQQQRRQQLTAQGLSQGISQMQGPHAHPQATNGVPNGLQAQPQRFHAQVSQAQISSPVVRTGTPQSHSSPPVNSMANVPMQHSTSSMGGSPQRPGSVVHQNQPQRGPQGMTAQRSQQSQAGTPHIPHATPNMASTPLNRQMSSTPRMNHSSPVQAQMSVQQQQQQMMMMNNVHMQHMNPAQQAQFRQQQLQMLRQNQQAGMVNNQQNQQQFLEVQAQAQARAAQMLRQQQQQQGMMGNPQMAQHAAAQMAAMNAQGIHGNVNANFGGNNPNMANIQQMQNMQQVQRLQMQQAQAQAQVRAQMQAQQQQQSQQGMTPQQIFQQQVRTQAASFYRERLSAFQSQHPGGPSPEAEQQFRLQCQQDATGFIQRYRRTQAIAAQQQQHQYQQAMMAAQNGMNNMGSLQNGMGLQ